MTKVNPYQPLADVLWQGIKPPGKRPKPATFQPALAWAVEEALTRLEPYRWFTRTADKPHTCQRGHAIHEGDVYAVYRYGAARATVLMLCLDCAALVAYLAGAHQREPVLNTHWQVTKQAGVYLNEQGELSVSPRLKNADEAIERLLKRK